tara:strand:- start:756 stop:1700 length:945 start_codon:yes stop_codon:yes gene_type:complete
MNLDEILTAYKCALLIRNVEKIIADNYKNGFMRCPTHLSIGQELVPSIYSLNNTKNDLAVSTHRAHAHYLAKGGCIDRFFDELHGLSTGCSGGNGGSMHLIDEDVGFMGSTAIVANTIPVGVGLAEGQKILKEDSITSIFLGEAATEEGVFYESLNYSKVRNIRCLFVIENNNYSVYTPIKPRQSTVKIEDKIKGFNVRYSRVKKHNFFELNDHFVELRKFMFERNEPAVLEVDTHRYLEHCGPNQDDELGYRPIELLNFWQNLDVIDLYKSELLKRGKKTEELIKIGKEINQLVKSRFQKSEEKHKIERKLNV